MYQNGAWFKDPETGAYVSWHQDATYYGMDPLKLVTAWIALSPATLETGCMQVLPGSHKLGQLPVEYSEVTPDNLLSSGQNTVIDRAGYTPVTMALQPGEMSVHHCAAVHASHPNSGRDRRIGFSIAFVSPDVRQTTSIKASAMLMRGKDSYGHYPLDEVPPLAADDPATIARHEKAVRLYRDKTVECGNGTAWVRIG
ncbi:MAG: 1-deoxypentalenic acid 11-beta-hydroxylase [Pseudomonadota bacterium]|jgi:ectoine hydroxylase-related dioxygenase (phytanoyl-CoA dioxygenase family)